MSANRKLPLTEPQKRHLTVTLAALDKQLAKLRQRLERRPGDSRLVRHEEPIDASEAGSLQPVIAEAESQLRRIADDLGLETQNEPARRAFIAGLEMSCIRLYECRAGGGLSGYGAVMPATADFLEREIPKLDQVIQLLIRRLQQGGDRD